MLEDPQLTKEDYIYVACNSILIFGLFLDGWAHNQGLPEDFFTPWHAVLYSGYFASALWLLYNVFLKYGEGNSFRSSIGPYYNYSVAGVFIFLIAGVGDMIWHIIFGIEEGVEALLSPTHLLLAVGGSLLFLGPLQKVLGKQLETNRDHFVVSTQFVFITSVILFFTQFLSPFAQFYSSIPYDAYDERSWETAGLGVSGFLVTAIVLLAAIFLMYRLWEIKWWSVSYFLFMVLSLVSAITEVWEGILLAIPISLILGYVYQLFKQTTINIRVFSLLFSSLLFGMYFLALAAYGDLAWSPDLWAGTIVMSALLACC